VSWWITREAAGGLSEARIGARFPYPAWIKWRPLPPWISARWMLR
jgi:hypothetical protein